MKMRKKILKKGAKIATKILLVSLFTNAIKRGIISGVKRIMN